MEFSKFNVNDPVKRKKFLTLRIIKLLHLLRSDSTANWGKMNAQHMVEHLIWAFKVSSGKIKINREIPVKEHLRLKRFLYNNHPTPIEFQNPALNQKPVPYQYASLSDAVKALGSEIDAFYRCFEKNPETKINHPVFGLLNEEEWERAHYKHCFHHLLQFNLIEQKKKESN